ncbi:MAG: mechanosensitive ion channel protein, partial [Roseibium sp.]|nr:mechanosensitive ion channel protein [Roseibium sp.]
MRARNYFFFSIDLDAISSRITVLILTCLLIVGFSMTVGTLPAHAQGITGVISSMTKSDEAEKTETDAQVTDDEEDANRDPEADEAEGTGLLQDVDEFVDEAVAARDVFKSILKEIPTIHDTMLSTLQAEGEERGLRWIPAALIDIAIAVALGLLASSLLARWGRRQFVSMYRADVYSRSDKIIYLFLRALLMIVGVVLFFVVAVLVYLTIGTGLEAANETAMVVLGVVSVFMCLRIVFMNLLAPDAGSHRLLKLTNQEAGGLYRALLLGSGVSLAAIAFCLWMERLGLSEDAHKIALIAASALSMLILIGISVVYRKVIARLIRGELGTEAPVWRRVLANVWHFVAIFYFVVAWSISAVRILLD